MPQDNSEQANTQLVQQLYRNFGNGDIAAVLELLDEDVEWILPAMDGVPFSGSRRGRAQVREFFRALQESQDVVEFQPERFLAGGDEVVVFGRFKMRVRSTGKISASEWVQVWTVTGGRVKRSREYVDTLAVYRAHSPSGA